VFRLYLLAMQAALDLGVFIVHFSSPHFSPCPCIDKPLFRLLSNTVFRLRNRRGGRVRQQVEAAGRGFGCCR
jgi:hypothetical protein